MRIFIGPTEIAGIASGLCYGFCKIDVDAELILSQPHPFGYGKPGKRHWLPRIWVQIGALYSSITRKQIIRKILLALSLRLWSFMVLAWSLQRFDAFIFIFGQTITNTRLELWLMRVFGKRVIFLYLGSDARPPYINGTVFPDGCLVDAEKARSTAFRIKERLQLQEKYGSICINSPATAHFHEKPFINWFAIGLPKHVESYPLHEITQQPNQKVRILHSPSNPLAKGTPIILKAVSRLIQKGHPIELIKIEGMPNSRVIEELAHCDFVVDQLYSDTPLATFATEAAHFGKPAVVGGYFASVVHSYIQKENIPPSLFVHPDEIEKAIEKLIVDVKYRLELGQKAQTFVRTCWAPEEVARRFMRLIQDDIPDAWWFDPQGIRYVQGGGIPEAHARKIVHDMLVCCGKASLRLEDKPELEKAFLKFAGLDEKPTKC
jgi:hypothetical protein